MRRRQSPAGGLPGYRSPSLLLRLQEALSPDGDYFECIYVKGCVQERSHSFICHIHLILLPFNQQMISLPVYVLHVLFYLQLSNAIK